MWKTTLVVAAVGAMVAGPAFAQSKGSDDSQAPKSPSTPPSSTEQTKPGSSSTDQSTTGTGSPSMGQSKPGGTMSDADKGTKGSGTLKSEQPSTKDSGTMKSERPGATSDRKSMAKPHDESLKAVQQALKDKGHDPGPIDGVMGPRTSQALKDFQKAEGLTVTGQLDSKTRDKLGVEGAAKK